MSPTVYSTLIVSLIGAVVALVVFAARHRDLRLWTVTLLVGLVSAGVWYENPSPFGTRADDDALEIAAVAICYVAMLLGMMAEYVYRQAEKGQERLTFTPMAFMMPILASPIVFIPLVTIAGQVKDVSTLSQAKVMVYLVAFQNGFFWRSFFEQRRQTIAEGART